MEDFASVIVESLARVRISASAEGIARMLREKNVEPAALVISAIGGDKGLLTRVIAAFNADRNDLPAHVRSACEYFSALRTERSLALLGQYFQGMMKPRSSAAQHVTVQSGQSLRLRATTAGQKPAMRTNLSERLGQSLRK